MTREDDEELLAIIAEEPPARAGRSVVEAIISSYGPAAQEGLRHVLESWDVPRLREMFARRGHPVSETTLRRYRRETLGI